MKKAVIVLSLAILSSSVFASTTIDLSSSVDMAMKRSPTMLEASEKLKAEEARLTQAFGTLLPTLSLSGNIGSSYQQPSDLEFGTTTVTMGTSEIASTSGYNLTLSQPLFAGGRLLSAYDIAKASYEMAKQSFRSSKNDMTYNVLNSYYGVLRAKKLSELAKESLDLAKAHLNQVKAMYSAGITTKADVLRSEVQVANSEQGATRANNAYELAKDTFNNTIGRGLDVSVDLNEKGFTSESATVSNQQELIDTAFKSRPEWLSFELRKLISEKSVNIANGSYWPNVALVGSYGNSKRTYPSYINTDQNFWTVAAQANWTLFDGFITPAKVTEADSNLKAMLANESNIKNNILVDLKGARLNLTSAIEVLASAKKEVASAVENYYIAEQKYKNGAGSNLEVIDAQVARSQAKTNLYQAQFDLQIAKAKINKSVGSDMYKLY